MTVPNLAEGDEITETWVDEVANLLNALTQPWTSYSPQLDQGINTNIAKTVNYAKYVKSGRLVHVSFNVSVTGVGLAGNEIRVWLPTPAAAIVGVSGAGQIYDVSTNTSYAGTWVAVTVNSVCMVHDTSGANSWGTLPNIAVAAGDGLRGTITYEAAS